MVTNLTFCLGLVGAARPVRFATAPGSGHALEVLVRADSRRPPDVDGGKPSAVAPARDDRAIAFYQHLGFITLAGQPMTLFLPVSTAEKTLL